MLKYFGLLYFLTSVLHAQCIIYKQEDRADPMNDALYSLLSQSVPCPENIKELKKIITYFNLSEETAMVANRGRNNPGKGSFNFISSIKGVLPSGDTVAKGDFFLRYSTRLKHKSIILNQKPKNKTLFLEAIAWDNTKKLYNFYELRGIKKGKTRWFYRGDSKDAYNDNVWLYRKIPQGENPFGDRMRCSACHNTGGPIFKELDPPHNDWWRTNRPLILQPNSPDSEVKNIIDHLVDAGLMAHHVETGGRKLAASPTMKRFLSELSLQEQLRPLFCTAQINLQANEHYNNKVEIPSEFFINPLLASFELSLPLVTYKKLLEEYKMNFPETSLRDADHSWLAPVKAHSEIEMIKQLQKQRLVSRKFIQAVLMVDFEHPVFSVKRCSLLKLVPEVRQKEWLSIYLARIKHQSKFDSSAAQLLFFLNDDGKRAQNEINYYHYYLAQLLTLDIGVRKLFNSFIINRRSVGHSDMSQNPLGQILEPGSRIIFPERMNRIEGDS